MPSFVIEHLEPRVFKWCRLEYAHISKWVGRRNLLFTNTRSSVLNALGSVNPKSVKDLRFERACVLDPESDVLLTPEIASKFDFFIFGGILGDDPPKDRTKTELTKFLPYPSFNLGKDQMSTDTAVIVTKFICDGKQLSDLKFQRGIDVEVGMGESVRLPYKYLVIDGKPLLAPGILDMLKKQKHF